MLPHQEPSNLGPSLPTQSNIDPNLLFMVKDYTTNPILYPHLPITSITPPTDIPTMPLSSNNYRSRGLPYGANMPTPPPPDHLPPIFPRESRISPHLSPLAIASRQLQEALLHKILLRVFFCQAVLWWLKLLQLQQQSHPRNFQLWGNQSDPCQ